MNKPKMTSRHFELIAQAIVEARSTAVQLLPLGCDEAIDFAAEALADALEGTNPAFNRDRFLKACGTE